MKVLLPELLKTDAGQAQATLHLRLPEGLHYFQGHFPGAPILPGVVQIDWAQHYAMECFRVSGRFAGMEAVKFQQVLQPGDEVTLSLDYNAERGRLKFQYSSARGRHSSGVLLYGQAEQPSA